MDIFLIITAGIFLLVGFMGSVLPVLPGTPLSYIGIILLHLSSKVELSTQFLIGWGLAVIAVQILDYAIPIWGAKKFGGSKLGVWGSIVGMLVGAFFGPLGITLGPFVGAMVGELMAGKAKRDALKAAFGTFVGFLLGTISKLIVAGLLIYFYVEALINS